MSAATSIVAATPAPAGRIEPMVTMLVSFATGRLPVHQNDASQCTVRLHPYTYCKLSDLERRLSPMHTTRALADWLGNLSARWRDTLIEAAAAITAAKYAEISHCLDP